MKKTILWILVLMLSISMVSVFSLTGCKEPEVIVETVTETVTETVVETVEVETTVAEVKISSIPFVCNYPLSDFFVPTQVGYIAAADEYGVTPEWLGPADNSEMTQISMIETLVARGNLDGLIVYADNPMSMKPALGPLLEQGIPIICTFQPPSDELYELYNMVSGPDNFKAGQLMAESFVQNIMGEGVWAKAIGYEGMAEPEGKVAILADNPGTILEQRRMAGARDVLEKYPGIEIVGEFDSTVDISKAMEVAGNVITANPDLIGFITVGSIPTAASGMMLEKNDLVGKVIICGMDLLPQTLVFIQEKVIASTVGQQPYYEGYNPVKVIGEFLLNGVPIPEFMPSEVETVNLDNVDAIMERESKFLESIEE